MLIFYYLCLIIFFICSYCLFFFFFKVLAPSERIYIFAFRDRKEKEEGVEVRVGEGEGEVEEGGEGKREIEKNINQPPPLHNPYWVRISKPLHVPWPELNQWPLSARDDAQLSHISQGCFLEFEWSDFVIPGNQLIEFITINKIWAFKVKKNSFGKLLSLFKMLVSS